VPGSSEVFVGGVIAYADAVKSELLHVAPALVAEHGAVSEPVARSMALGAARRFGVQAALSITGIAGPGGGSPAKPVGTVWVGCVLAEVVETRRILFAGSRPEIRARAAQAALFMLHRRLSGALSSLRL
jgi:nicotinamide-nucleotide amidase